ncbi:MAG: hypothetical protein AAFO99_01100 [Bacteroidota bacterium]
MKKKSFIVLLLSIVVFGCSSDSGEQTPTDDNDPPVQGETDTTAPVISLSGLEDTLEVLTTLNFSVTDASENVTTTVSIDDEDVFSSMEKQFSYELDPFDFTTGEKTLMVTSTDDSGNMGSESQRFELKKLLFLSSDIISNDAIDFFIAINEEETGKLIAYRKMESVEDGRFYAPDDFERQEIVATKYILGKNGFTFDLAESYADLQPGIRILTQEQASSMFNLSGIVNEGNFQLNITDTNLTPFNFSSFDYIASSSVLSNTTSYDFRYDIENTDNIFIYSIPFNSTNLEEYRYFIIEDFSDQTISFNNFKTVSKNNIETINLPPGTVNFNFELRGYLDIERYESDNFHQLFKLSGSLDIFANTIDVPVIDNYGVLSQRLFVGLEDGRGILSTFRGLSDLVLPNVGIERSGNIINTSGTYDYSELSLDINGAPIPNSPNPRFFRWFYSNDNDNAVSIPFENFEIPEEVVSNLNTKGFDLGDISSPSNLVIGLVQHELEVNYQDRIFYNLTRNEKGNRTSVFFDLNL